MEHGISRTLRLKVGMLHLKLRTLALELRTWNLHQCMIWKWCSHKLTGLQKVGLSVASGMLSKKTRLALAILLHFFWLILNYDGLVNPMLKI
jgi:hypothetical protein